MSGILTHSPAEVLRYLLIQLGHGVLPPASSGWPISVSSEQDLPDQVITIYDTAGRYDGRSMQTGQKWEFYGVQIRVRGLNHSDCQLKARQIAVALDESIRNNVVTISTTQYGVYSTSRTSGPMSIGKEPNTNRVLFTINAVVALRQITT
jgi:hypothetical protein